jgi:hypothetical protein
VRITAADGTALAAGKGVSLAPGAAVEFHYELPPGIYRAQIIPGWDGALAVQRTFQLETPDPAAIRAADEASAAPAPTKGRAKREDRLEVELRGVLDSNDAGPVFSVILREWDGSERKAQFRLNDKIFGDWVISEYSPAHNTMTVTHGDKLMIIERGTPETLEKLPEEAG